MGEFSIALVVPFPGWGCGITTDVTPRGYPAPRGSPGALGIRVPAYSDFIRLFSLLAT